MKCAVDGCAHDEAPEMGGLCYGHYSRKRRGKALDAPLRHYGDPRRTLFEAALALTSVGDDDAAGLRAIRRFWKAHHRAAEALRQRAGAR